eukprot:1377606-Amorphochlora_amoeboformis.AAC.1
MEKRGRGCGYHCVAYDLDPSSQTSTGYTYSKFQNQKIAFSPLFRLSRSSLPLSFLPLSSLSLSPLSLPPLRAGSGRAEEERVSGKERQN